MFDGIFGFVLACTYCVKQLCDMSRNRMDSEGEAITTVLIDLSGTLHIGSEAIAGSVEGLRRLMSKEPPLTIRFVTNTTKESRKRLVHQLHQLGFEGLISEEQVFTSAQATRRYLEEHQLRPFFLIDKGLDEDFLGMDQTNPNAVVVGLAKEAMNYEKLNHAFRLILQGAQLIAIHKGLYFAETDGLSLGPGPFVTALEVASNTQAHVVGKPSSAFYRSVLEAACIDVAKPQQVVMIGDDLRQDVGGAQALGLRTVLVQTGKFRTSDAHDPAIRPDYIAPTFQAAIEDYVLQNT